MSVGALTLVTGGARSGKSAYAQKLAERMPPPRAYIATCPVIDGEMSERIEAHRRDREGKGYTTFEEPKDLAAVIRKTAGHSVAVVDCLTLWVNNLMREADERGAELGEKDIEQAARKVLDAVAVHPVPVIFVTNEVGMGIIPANAVSRKFVDLAGRLNQLIAGGADEVILMTSGIPLCVKSANQSPGPERKK